jgi:hypothetical protein
LPEDPQQRRRWWRVFTLDLGMAVSILAIVILMIMAVVKLGS